MSLRQSRAHIFSFCDHLVFRSTFSKLAKHVLNRQKMPIAEGSMIALFDKNEKINTDESKILDLAT